MARCVMCTKEIHAGPALIVLEGELQGEGKFEAKETLGPACLSHRDQGTGIDASRFPLTFRL